MQTITITAYRRPHYFEQLLRSLIANNLEDWQIVIFLEPSPRQDEFKRLCDELLAGHNWHLIVNPKLLGVRRNPHTALTHVFEQGSDLNLYLEEDFLLAPDVTRLANWYARNNAPDEVCLNLLAGGCLSRSVLSQSENPEVMVATRQFNSLGFVLTAEQWNEHFAPQWFRFPFGLFDPHGAQVTGWDCAIYAYVMSNPQLRVLQPLSARVSHIGRDEGEFCNAAIHDSTFSDMYLYQEISADLTYRRCEDWMELPHTVRSHLFLKQEIVEQQLIGRHLMQRFLFILWPIYLLKIEFQLWRMRQRRK